MSNTSMLPSSKPATPPARRHPLALMHEHLDDLFGTFFGHARSEAQLGHFWPNVDVSESNGDVKVKVDLPGMDEKEIETWIADDVVTLRGEKKQEKEEKGEQTYRLERSYGSFQREVSLPVKVDAAKAKAVFAKGVLTITVPKSVNQPSVIKKIAIESA